MLEKLTKLNKEFDINIVKKAKNIVEKYNIIINLEDGEYYGNSVEMPTVFSDGKTEEECIKKTKEALIIAVSYLLEQGQYLDNTEEGDRILGEAAKKIREECDLITEEEFYKETEMKKGE